MPLLSNKFRTQRIPQRRRRGVAVTVTSVAASACCAMASLPYATTGFMIPSHTATRGTLETTRSHDRQMMRRAKDSWEWAPLFVSSTSDEVAQSVVEDADANNELDPNLLLLQQHTPLPDSFMDKLQAKVGTIDDDRYLFPDLASGDVTRMASSLRRDPTTGALLHNPGHVLSATALVAAGVVSSGCTALTALPLVACETGLGPSTLAGLVAGGYTIVSGLLVAELAMHHAVTAANTTTKKSSNSAPSLVTLYSHYMPKRWSSPKLVAGAFSLMYSTLLVGLVAQGGDLLLQRNDSGALQGLLSAVQDPVAAVALTGALVASATAVGRSIPSDWQRRSTSVAAVGLVGLMAATLSTGASNMDWGALFAPASQHIENIVDTFPLLFLSLVSQSVVPRVVHYLEGDRAKIRTAIVAGTAIPLASFLAWNAMMLGNVVGLNDVVADPFAAMQHSSGTMGAFLTAFASLSLAVSTIRASNGLVDAVDDFLPADEDQMADSSQPVFVVLPPSILALLLCQFFSLDLHDIFIDSLEFGGAFGVSTLFLVLPPVMVWNLRYGQDKPALVTKPMVPFGKIPLGSMYKAAGTLILEQGVEKLGLFDAIHNFFS